MDWTQIVLALIGLAVVIANGWIAIQMAKLNAQQKAVTLRVDEVATIDALKMIKLTAISDKVEEVSRIAEKADNTDKINALASQVEEVRKATNGMQSQLLEVTEKEALLRGGNEERERQATKEAMQ